MRKINRQDSLLKFRQLRDNAQTLSRFNSYAKIFALELQTVITAIESGAPDSTVERIASASSLETYLVRESDFYSRQPDFAHAIAFR